eukprot:CAMPEP_0194437004 /NCGR_PEP_ID=MMETSP0176-20130528/97638_1 /TAXON_ID=216777 /ORGANISM="Proboscia alata, Strain PI-D3" /LENGTH=54 /DNA_ID=CAMNT_0039257881 /DNA_START=100 /DNA_END=261 /DNA_ORIENTATION=-
MTGIRFHVPVPIPILRVGDSVLRQFLGSPSPSPAWDYRPSSPSPSPAQRWGFSP